MIITLTLNAGVKSELCFMSDGSSDHRRFVRLQGAPQYKGTYKYWDLKLLLRGHPVQRPGLLSIVIREADASSEGLLTYVEAYEDDELGLEEPTQFAFEAEYAPAAFDKLWSVLTASSDGALTVSVSVKAPKTDISGHEGILDASEAPDGWPANFYASRI